LIKNSARQQRPTSQQERHPEGKTRFKCAKRESPDSFGHATTTHCGSNQTKSRLDPIRKKHIGDA
jgi:hypothetical protein